MTLVGGLLSGMTTPAFVGYRTFACMVVGGEAERVPYYKLEYFGWPDTSVAVFVRYRK